MSTFLIIVAAVVSVVANLPIRVPTCAGGMTTRTLRSAVTVAVAAVVIVLVVPVAMLVVPVAVVDRTTILAAPTSVTSHNYSVVSIRLSPI